MDVEIPIIPPASQIVLVPDTQMSTSQKSNCNGNEQTEDTGKDDFLFHGQGATAIGYHQAGNQ